MRVIDFTVSKIDFGKIKMEIDKVRMLWKQV